MSFLNIVAALAGISGLMALLALATGALERATLRPRTRDTVMGLVFGLTAMAAMAAPMEPLPGVVIDGRAIIVGLAAAFGGGIAGAVATLIAGTFRVLVLGGPGAWPATVAIVLAAVLGLAWSRLWLGSARPRMSDLVVGGFLISLQFSAVVLLPADMAWSLVLPLYPVLLLASVTSALVFGALVEREHRRIETEHGLSRAALVDPLTGLPNRRRFDETLATATADGDAVASRRTLVLIDIDRFKMINDHYGHAAGDAALRRLAEILRRHVRESDLVARIGGEEFAILLNRADFGAACAFLERLMGEIRSTSVRAADSEFRITVSAGLTELPAAGKDSDTLLREADQALYAAKRGGRDRYEIAGLARSAWGQDAA